MSVSHSAFAQKNQQDGEIAYAEAKLCHAEDLTRKVVRPVANLKGRIQRVNATWYGAEFHGKPMANGEIFNACDPTIVASKIFPTEARLQLRYNDTSIVVTVKDSLDKGAEANLDVSYAVAVVLGMVKRGRVNDLEVKRLN